jgi:hypothetical protein
METNGHKPPTEYGPGTEFPGVVARTTEDSTPAWPRTARSLTCRWPEDAEVAGA